MRRRGFHVPDAGMGVAGMTHTHFLRIKKLTGKEIIQAAAKHNLREIAAEIGVSADSHIDPQRVGLNVALRGSATAADVAKTAQALMDNAGVKFLRKDAVRALEIIFSLPPETTIATEPFFTDAVQWAERYFSIPIISAVIHHDEAAPHCHVLLLPLVDGRMLGSDLVGGKAKLKAMQDDFHEQVGTRYGLTRQAPHKRASAALRRQAIELAFNTLDANSGLQSKINRVLVEAHLNNPEPLLLALGLAMPKQKVRETFAGIMTRPTKPEKPIGFVHKKPIGFAAATKPKKEQTLCSVGFGISPPVISTEIPQQTEEIATKYSRQHDTDNAASYWNETTGEFIKPPARTSAKQAVAAMVKAALQLH
ncbi:MAG: plasmid recombination protein [Burkholderiales bacterium]|nr:plasmid recombination protein [Burkholderiales bacterium]